MAAQTLLPSFTFYFTVSEIRRHPNVRPRPTLFGAMRPPKPLGSNIALHNHPQAHLLGHHDSHAYYFDGSRVQAVTIDQLVAVQGNLVEFRTISMYFDHSASRFWLVDFDATTNAVGDGQVHDEEPDSDDSDAEEEVNDETDMSIDWIPLTFRWERSSENDVPLGLSTIEIAGSRLQLFATRDDQTWPNRIFAENYLPIHHRLRGLPRQAAPFGSLNGNLAALIALVAFTAVPTGYDVHDALLHCIRATRWRSPHEGQGRQDERGILVKVWIGQGWQEVAETYENQYLFR